MRCAENLRRGLAAPGALRGLAATLGVAGSVIAGQKRREDGSPRAPSKIHLHPRSLRCGHKPRSRTPQIRWEERMQRLTKSVALAGVIAIAAAATPSVAAPVTPLTTILVPGAPLTSFDISFADPVTGNIFIADRSNAGVDIFSGSSLTWLGRAAGFQGVQPGGNSVSGPDGVLTVTSGGVTTLYAGDGNSTLKIFDATIPTAPILQKSISTGGTTRVDEMAYSPLTHQVLAANNAEKPAYGNLFSTTNGHAPVSLTNTPIITATPIIVPPALGGIPLGGMEQPA